MSKELTTPATGEMLSDETIRDWGKKLLRNWAEYVIANNLRGGFPVGQGGWSKVGASDPDQIIDAIFSMIQVTLLGYGGDIADADSKRKQIDDMLRVRADFNPKVK